MRGSVVGAFEAAQFYTKLLLLVPWRMHTALGLRLDRTERPSNSRLPEWVKDRRNPTISGTRPNQ